MGGFRKRFFGPFAKFRSRSSGLHGVKAVTRIAMVCLGNICRSPMAEAVASAMVEEAGLAGRVRIESFGTLPDHVGEGTHGMAAAALARRGWPVSDHRARQITPDDIARVNLILCAEHANRTSVMSMAGTGLSPGKVHMLRTYDPQGGPEAEVPEPGGGDDARFDQVLDIVERSCRGLVSELAAVID